MSTANPLDLPLITDGQSSKHVTHNDAILKVSQALGNRVEVDVSAGNATVIADTAQRNYFISVVGASVARDVTLPAKNRTVLIRAASANSADVTIKVAGGTGTVVFPPGSNALVVTTEAATVEGFFLAQTAVVSALLDLADFPTNYSGAGGKLVAVKADESGVEFINAPSGGGGATALNDLNDVVSANPAPGDVLVYDDGLFAYVNVPGSTIGGSGATALTQLDDVLLTAPAEGELLVYDAAQSKFVNKTVGGSSPSSGLAPSIKTVDYTLEIDDTRALILLNDCNLIVPTYAAVALPVGTTVALAQWGVTASSIVAATGVTIHSADTLTFAKQYAGGSLVHVSLDVWLFTAYTTGGV